MGFNDDVRQVKDRSQSGNTLFRENVKARFLTGDKQIQMRILPAYPVGWRNPTDWIQCRLPDDDLTNWGKMVYLARFIGHGTNWTTRKDFVSPYTFATPDQPVSCPFTTMFSLAKSMVEWSYLTEDIKDDAGNVQVRAPLSRPTPNLVCNIINVDKQDEGVVLGLMSKSASDALLGDENGLASMRSIQMDSNAIASNYMLKWMLGDFTDPSYGIIFIMSKKNDKGKMSGYAMKYKQDAHNRLVTLPVTAEQLAARYDLNNPLSYMQRMSDEEIVKNLASVLNGKTPDRRYHEFELLRMAFPQYAGDRNIIPDPPALGTYTNIPAQIPQAPTAPQAAPAQMAPLPPPTAPVYHNAPSPAASYHPELAPSPGYPPAPPPPPMAPVAGWQQAPAPVQPYVAQVAAQPLPPPSTQAPAPPPPSGAAAPVPGMSTPSHSDLLSKYQGMKAAGAPQG